jgi:hypothetical protein
MSKQVFERPFVLSMGPQRSGTIWLERYLKDRSDICLPADVKETFFFDRHYTRGMDFYRDHFRAKPEHVLLMEITTTLFDHEEAPKRVYETFGNDIQLICPLRNPVVRSYSLYLHYARYGIARGSLREACFQTPQIIESSKYAKILKRWYEYYEPSKIKLLYQEDLEHNEATYIAQLCQALGISYLEHPEITKNNYNVIHRRGSRALAKITRNIAKWLRDRKLYSVINLANAIGLKPFLLGRQDADAAIDTIPRNEFAWLNDQLAEEIEALETITGPITQWK